MIQKYVIRLTRIIQFAIGSLFGVFALFWTAPEVKSLNASVARWQQILGTLIFALAYWGISALAIRDVRASSLLAAVLTLLSTPVYVLMWLFSQWNTRSSQEVIPLLWGIGGNIILFLASILGFVLSRQPRFVAVVTENQ
jgi:hypothetical protein